MAWSESISFQLFRQVKVEPRGPVHSGCYFDACAFVRAVEAHFPGVLPEPQINGDASGAAVLAYRQGQAALYVFFTPRKLPYARPSSSARRVVCTIGRQRVPTDTMTPTVLADLKAETLGPHIRWLLEQS